MSIPLLMELQELRNNVEKFVRAMDEEYYLNLAGLKEDMNTAVIFQKYKNVFEPKVLSNVKRRKTKAKKEDKRKLRFLEHILTSGYLEHKVKDLTDRRNTLESKLNIKIRGKNIPFRLAAVKMVNEDNRALRGEIYDARNRATDDINVILKNRMKKLHELSKRLDYSNYAHLYSRIRNIDFKKLMRELETLIRATDRIYVDKFSALTARIDLKLKDSEKHDMAYLFRAKPFDKYFKKDRAIPTLKRTLKGLGITLDQQKNVVLDAEERPKKSPRAFCAPLRVPDKIMLVIMPMGGYGDYDTLLHEAGHAEHYAHVLKRQAMEYKYLGDNSVTETYAFILQYLTMNEKWIKNNTSMNSRKLSEYLDFVYTQKVYFLRRYAAKLRYELMLHQRGLKGMDDAYKRTLESVLKFKHPKNHYLTDLDDGFYASQYLRAWLFEAQLRLELEEKFGDDWFLKKAAGDYLKSLWAEGQKYNVEEISEGIGYELGPKELIEDFKAHLK